MTPLRITATLQDVVAMTLGTIAFDALLGAMYAVVNHLPGIRYGEIPVEPLPLPLMREPGGRFDLASFSVCKFDSHEVCFFHKQFPQREAKHMTQMKRVNIATGANKSWRKPMSLAHSEGDVITWWCVGDKDEIENLIQYCHHVGKRRGAGFGKVLRWEVVQCEPWGDGFPIVLDGRPMRNLPHNWPGLTDPDLQMSRLTYPYWATTGRELCAVPG